MRENVRTEETYPSMSRTCTLPPRSSRMRTHSAEPCTQATWRRLMPTLLSALTTFAQAGSSALVGPCGAAEPDEDAEWGERGAYVSSRERSVAGLEGAATDLNSSCGRIAASSRCEAFSDRPQAATSSGPSGPLPPSRLWWRSSRARPPVRSTAWTRSPFRRSRSSAAGGRVEAVEGEEISPRSEVLSRCRTWSDESCFESRYESFVRAHWQGPGKSSDRSVSANEVRQAAKAERAHLGRHVCRGKWARWSDAKPNGRDTKGGTGLLQRRRPPARAQSRRCRFLRRSPGCTG